jgi:hypothetical protein
MVPDNITGDRTEHEQAPGGNRERGEPKRFPGHEKQPQITEEKGGQKRKLDPHDADRAPGAGKDQARVRRLRQGGDERSPEIRRGDQAESAGGDDSSDDPPQRMRTRGHAMNPFSESAINDVQNPRWFESLREEQIPKFLSILPAPRRGIKAQQS